MNYYNTRSQVQWHKLQKEDIKRFSSGLEKECEIICTKIKVIKEAMTVISD